MRNVNISNFRKDLFSYVNQAIDFNEAVNVNTKNGNVVLLSEEEYNGLMETLYLLSAPGMKERLEEGMNSTEEDFVEFDWRKALK